MAESRSSINLVLAHLVGDNYYTKTYAASKKPTILDNGAFELGVPYEPERLIELGKMINAQYIVLPDYPGQSWEFTIDAAKEYIPKFKAAGFKTFFVPQSEEGDFDGYMNCWDWAINEPNIDLIGCSILGAPKSLPSQDRLITRFIILRAIENAINGGYFDEKLLVNRIHMLGMLDTVNEIALTRPFHWMINSWDTSAAIWAGINGLDIKKTSTKLATPVDFACNSANHKAVIANIDYINTLL